MKTLSYKSRTILQISKIYTASHLTDFFCNGACTNFFEACNMKKFQVIFFFALGLGNGLLAKLEKHVISLSNI